MDLRNRWWMVGFGILLTIAPGRAQVQYPPIPKTYQIEIRYRLQMGLNEHIIAYRELRKYLGNNGFTLIQDKDTNNADIDFDIDRIRGTIPSEKVAKLLEYPAIKTIIYYPENYTLKETSTDPVRVRIYLSTGFTEDRQKEFHQLVSIQLQEFGFQENQAYDHKYYTELKGTYPSNKVRELLRDLRLQPGGWFFSKNRLIDLPEIYRNSLPIRRVEVLPDPEGVPSHLPAAKKISGLDISPALAEKLSPRLLETLSFPNQLQNIRLELIFSTIPSRLDYTWRDEIMSVVPSAKLEGRIGSLCTLTLVNPADVLKLARLPMIVRIRYPHVADPARLYPARNSKQVDPLQQNISKTGENNSPSLSPSLIKNPNKSFPIPSVIIPLQGKANSQDSQGNGADALTASKLLRLHENKHRGQGVRVILIDTDFTGLEKFRGAGLPEKVTYIDFTSERNASILPEPIAPDLSEGNQNKVGIGHGTHCALALSQASPEVELILIRVAADAPYQCGKILEYVLGDKSSTEAIRLRLIEFGLEQGEITRLRKLALEEYKKAFDNFDDTDEAKKRRSQATAALKDLDIKEEKLSERVKRLEKLEADLHQLTGVPLIVSCLNWNTGHAIDSDGFLTKHLNDLLIRSVPRYTFNPRKIKPLPLWFQASGDQRTQAWIGSFRDRDNNNIMEFIPKKDPIHKGNWTRELNFIQFESAQNGSVVAELPEGANIRISIQWREPHDPQVAEEDYRDSNVPIELQLLHQLDPAGKLLASDEMDVVAISQKKPSRLSYEGNYGIYEQTIETKIPRTGKYALRVLGKIPLSLKPQVITDLAANDIYWELSPRIFLEVLDAQTQAKGKLSFHDYPSFLSGVGSPADSLGAITVGAANLQRQPSPKTSVGLSPNAILGQKPTIWSYYTLNKIPAGPAQETSLATAFAGGVAACFLSAGIPQDNFLNAIHIKPRQVIEVNEEWLNDYLQHVNAARKK